MTYFEETVILLLEQQNELLKALLSAQIQTLNTLNSGDLNLTEGDVFERLSSLSKRFE